MREPGAVADFTPAHSFEQGFTVPFPPDEVFALFGRVDEVASCLPGAAVTGRPGPDRVEGAMRVRLGPIAAAFTGTARIERDEVARSGRIVGGGQDGGGRSAAQGMVAYRVRPGEAAGSARVEITVGYTLKGALAQFGRPGLVRDLAGRITATFAGNLEARLAGRAPDAAHRDVDTLSLAGALLRGKVAGWLRALADRLSFHRTRS